MGNKNKWYRIGARAKSFLIVGAALTVWFLFLQNFGTVAGFVKSAFSFIAPFVWGVALAYLLSLLMVRIERLFLSKVSNKKTRRTLALVLTLTVFIAFIAGFFFAVIPQLVSSISSLVNSISGHLDSSEELVMGWADKIGLSRGLINTVFGSWEEIIKLITDWAKALIPEIAAAGVKLGSGIINAFISLFIAIYVLIDLEKLLAGSRRLIIALFGEKRHAQLEVLRQKGHKAFGGFLVGKIIDSTIIGVICFIFMLICGMNYAPLISFVIGVTNIIPTFGPFIGAIPSLFILFIIDPIEALWFLIFIVVLQQIDGNIIGPHILGDALGLSAMWILFAVVFFGSVWGVTGMIIGVPLFAIIYDIVQEFVRRKTKALYPPADPKEDGGEVPPGNQSG